MSRPLTRTSIARGHSRSGITLLEVLIAIGILAIGLSSVVALVPAGRSQAGRAVVLDRASNLAANALSDAVTFGLLRPDSLTSFSGLTVIDPLQTGTVGTLAWQREDGVFSRIEPQAPVAFHLLFTQGRDDALVSTGTSVDDQIVRADSPPLNAFADGVRAFQGRMSCIYAISPPVAPTPGRLSVVVFHGRDPGKDLIQLSVLNGVISGITADMGQEVKPGTVVFGGAGNPRFHQVVSFSFVEATNSAYVTFSTGPALLTGAHTVFVLPDSVGFAERTFTAEVSGPYLQ